MKYKRKFYIVTRFLIYVLIFSILFGSLTYMSIYLRERVVGQRYIVMNTLTSNTTVPDTSHKLNIEDIESTVIESTISNIIQLIYYDIPISYEDQEYIRSACDYYGFEEKLVYQIITVESEFNRYTVSHTDDHGLMQLNANYYSDYVTIGDAYDKDTEDFDIYDIRQNIIVGLRELSYWRNICEKRGYYNTSDILECYNRGFNYFKNTSKHVYSDKVNSVELDTITIEEEVS